MSSHSKPLGAPVIINVYPPPPPPNDSGDDDGGTGTTADLLHIPDDWKDLLGADKLREIESIRVQYAAAVAELTRDYLDRIRLVIDKPSAPRLG
jgi:hypothetical protein